jgi:uncharacterized OsmC-like protein
MSAQVTLRQQGAYTFVHTYAEGMPTVTSDLPPPLGSASGPSPEHFLASAVGSCLSSSLVFALSRFKEDPAPLATTVTAVVGRNDANRMRVLRLEARITLGRAAAELPHLERALATFEDYCTVTASVRAGIPVVLEVFDATGAKLK